MPAATVALSRGADPMLPVLKARAALIGTTAVCHLSGEIDLDTQDIAAAALRRACAYPCDLLCVDMREVTFFCCAGLNQLLSARSEAVGVGRAIALIAPSPQVRRLMQLTETADLFPVLPGIPLGHPADGQDRLHETAGNPADR
ncbi:STAS domain-containing protein [Kitasatospora sp. NPDC057940]|uniref:STAS domain-containing protein n=1 Tax=Kitasatospora sp. NPDC057940 TaxID=3346285 RepID=UPI0036DD515F